MQDRQALLSQGDEFSKVPVMGSDEAMSSLLVRIKKSYLEPKLTEVLITYVQSPSPENLVTLKSECDALIKAGSTLLTDGSYAESQATLSILSIISAVVAEKATSEQRAQFNFLALVRQALTKLLEFSAKLTTEDWVAIAIIWDEWLFSALPACLRVNSYHAGRPESISGLLACLLIQQVAGKVQAFATLVTEMRTAADI